MWQQRHPRPDRARGSWPARRWRANARRVPLERESSALAAARPLPALAGILSFVAYALVLAALLRASTAAVASVRETSVLIAAFLAAPLAGERVGPGRLSGAALVVAGVALIAVA